MSWHYLCKTEEIRERTAKEFLVDGRVIAAFFSEQRVYAIDGICAHQGGPIAQGRLDRTCITCPWHGWQYDIATGKNLLTGKQMLDCFELEFRGDEVWIKLEVVT